MSLLGETAPEPLWCIAFMFYKQRLASPLTVDFHFVIVRDIEPIVQRVKRQYECWNVDSTTLEIFLDGDPSPVIELDQQEQEVGQWKIYPLSSSSRISKAAIKNYQIGRRIPHCGFELELLSEHIQRLHHKVCLEGVSSHTYFHIRYPQPEAVPSVSTQVSPLVQQPSAATLQTVPQQPSPLAPQRTAGVPTSETWYTAFMFYKQQMASPLVADFHFVVVKDAESYVQEVKTAYQEWSGDTLKISFESDAIELDLQDQEVGSWKISPSAIPQITKAAVSNFQIGRWIPHCSFKLRLLSEKIPQPLVHKVALAGASPSFFYIKYDPVNPNDAIKSLEKIVTMSITNIGTQGYPGIGKTSVLDLAMGKDPAPTRTSTDCVDPPSRYLMIDSADSEEVEWEKVTTDKMSKMVREAVKKIIEENPSDKTQAHKPATAESNQTEFESHSRDAAEPLKPSVDESQTHPLVDIFPPVSSTQSDRHPVLSSSNDPWLSDFLKALYSSERSGVIFNAHWMMVTDSGGQPPFLDAAALFLQNSCLQIFPVKLNEPLSKIPDFSYFFDGVCASFDKSSLQFTHKQIIETLAKSVASIQPPYTPSATKCPKGAKFTIVGTFKDEAHKCSETIEEKNLILKEVLEPYRPFQVPYGSKVILPINAVTTNRKERERSAIKLRRLFKTADVTMEVDVKLRWFGFLLSLLTIAEKEHKVVLTLDECYKLGESLCMDKSETQNAIRFFHDISLIMHFDDPKLIDSVIINTKPVLTKLSKIITVSFLNEDFLADNYDIFPPPGAKELLQQHGRFSRDTLEKCGIKFTKPITLQFFLDILEHVKIVVAIDKESEYFMPCALSSLPEASVSHSSSPWVIRLRVRRGVEDIYIPIPVGYLPAVVVFLLTNFSSHFSTDRRHRQYRNKISLKYKRGGTVHLIERHLQLEIYFSLYKQFPKDCATIRDHILESIRLTEEKLHIIQKGEGAITKVDSFLCSCGKGSAHHSCAYNTLSGILECTESEAGELCILETQHSHWLGIEPGTLLHTNTASGSQSDRQTPVKVNPSQEPELCDLMTHVAYEAPSMWRQVGIQLKIEPATLKAFKAPNDDPTELFIQVFEQWKKEQKVPYTWTSIINALKAVKEREVASDIIEWLRTE